MVFPAFGSAMFPATGMGISYIRKAAVRISSLPLLWPAAAYNQCLHMSEDISLPDLPGSATIFEKVRIQSDEKGLFLFHCTLHLPDIHIYHEGFPPYKPAGATATVPFSRNVRFHDTDRNALSIEGSQTTV